MYNNDAGYVSKKPPLVYAPHIEFKLNKRKKNKHQVPYIFSYHISDVNRHFYEKIIKYLLYKKNNSNN